MSCGVGGVIFSVFVSGSISCCVLDKLSGVSQFWSSENLFSVGIFTVSFWAVMGSRDASQSVFFCSLSAVFSEQEDSVCEEGLGGGGGSGSFEFCQSAVISSLRKWISVNRLFCDSCRAWFALSICTCFLWRIWFSSYNFLMMHDCWETIFWSDVICEEKSLSRSSDDCFCSLIKWSCLTVLFFSCSRSPLVVIWNSVKSASSCPSVASLLELSQKFWLIWKAYEMANSREKKESCTTHNDV